MKAFKRSLIKLFWLCFSISMFSILGIAITKPLNNLVPQRMILFTLIWIGLYAGVWFIFCFLERKFPKLERIIKRCLPIYFIIFGAALFAVSCFLKSVPITDYENVYCAALQFAMGEDVTNWDYFARWTNNVGIMLLLSLLFRLGRWLPEQIDIYYFVLLINVLLVVIFVYCLYYLVNKFIKEHYIAVSLMTLFVSGVWIPFYANTSIFYSDQLSLEAAVFAVTLLVKGYQKRKWYIYYLFAGMLFGLGISIKVTVATAIIALIVTVLLFLKVWQQRKRMLVALCACVAMFTMFSCYNKTLPYQEKVEQLKAPIEYWFALGLVGAGTYADSEEFAISCLTAENLQQRTEIARQQIVGEIHNLWDLEHIIAKTRQNFGFGDLGAAGYYHIPVKENFLWNCFSMNGLYFWKYACLTTAFFFAVLFYLGIGGFLQFLKRDADNKGDAIFFLSALTFWGLCLFMMLWEAQDKFMYNHSGWMIIALLFSFKRIDEQLKNVFSKSK